MKFSIIMPAFNGSATISRAIESVIKQAHAEWELLIVDDASSDGTYEMARSFLSDDRIMLFRNVENLGVASTRNRAIDKASGDVICFLDCDDWWSPDKLFRQNLLFDQGADLVFGSYFRMSGSHRTLVAPPRNIDLELFKTYNFIGNLTGAYLIQNFGKVYQKNVRHEDYLMWYQILSKSVSVQIVRDPIAFYSVGQGISANKIKSAIWTFRLKRDYFFAGSSLEAFLSMLRYVSYGIAARLR